MTTTDATVCHECRRPMPGNTARWWLRDGRWVCDTCHGDDQAEDWLLGGTLATTTEALLNDIYNLGMAVTRKAISRRLTHQTCERIRELVQMAMGQLESAS